MNKTKSINVKKDVNIHLEDYGKSRSFFWFIWVLYAVVYMTKNCYNGAMASIVAEGTFTKSQTGLITAMFYIVYAPLQIVGGMFSDRYSPERMIKIGLLGGALANAVIFLNQNYYVMMGAWVFNAVAQFAVWPAVFKIVSSQLVRSKRKQMVYLISFSTYGGMMLSYIIAAFVSKWQYNFAISGVSLLLLAVGLDVYERKLRPYWKWDAPVETIGETDKAKSQDFSTMKIFRKSGVLFLVIGIVFSGLVTEGRSALAPVMLMENYETISSSAGNLLNLFMIMASMAGIFLAGKFLKNIKNEVAVICIFYGIMLPFLAICRFVGTVSAGMIIVCLCSAAGFESANNILRGYYNVKFVKYGKSGTAAGLCNAGASLSAALAVYGMPKMVEIFDWSTLIMSWPILILISIILHFISARKYKTFKES